MFRVRLGSYNRADDLAAAFAGYRVDFPHYDRCTKGNVKNGDSLTFDGFVKSPTTSLRGAKRRGNLMGLRLVTRLLRFARNDIRGVFGLFTISSTFP